MVNQVSRSHINKILKNSRQEVERLSAEIGREVVFKYDQHLLPDIIYERKEKDLKNLLGISAIEEGHRYHVMINLQREKSQKDLNRPLSTRRGKRRLNLMKLQKSGRLACHRLEKNLEQMNIRPLQSFWITNSVLTDLTSEQLEKIAIRKDVRSIIAVKLQPVITLDKSRPLIRADKVENELGIDGTCVEVAVIDTGIDINHPALAGIIISQQDLTGEGVGDNYGHGTHCAGIIASQDSKYRGIAPGVRIRDIKIIDQDGNSQPDWATAGIQAAVEAGVDVASNSWGWSHANGFWEDSDCSCVLCTAADNAVAAGVVFVVAAGNEDNDTCYTYDTHIRCPGNGCEVITVGASDDNDNMANFSSIGPTPDGRIKPDVTAPGVNIASCRASATSMGSTIDANWTNASGTSMACPHVAGVVALMLEKRCKKITPAEVKKILMATTVDIGAAPNEMGTGRVDALAAVNAT